VGRAHPTQRVESSVFRFTGVDVVAEQLENASSGVQLLGEGNRNGCSGQAALGHRRWREGFRSTISSGLLSVEQRSSLVEAGRQGALTAGGAAGGRRRLAGSSTGLGMAGWVKQRRPSGRQQAERAGSKTGRMMRKAEPGQSTGFGARGCCGPPVLAAAAAHGREQVGRIGGHFWKGPFDHEGGDKRRWPFAFDQPHRVGELDCHRSC